MAVTLVAVKQGRESSRVNRVIPRTGTEKCVYLLLTIKMNVINISLSIGKYVFNVDIEADKSIGSTRWGLIT